MVPSMIISGLHQRDFVQLSPAEGARQLRIWRCQDRIIWFLCLIYLAFSKFFIVVFLANITEDDRFAWVISALMSGFELLVLVPIAMSASIIIGTILSMCST